jgi:hypothetical protein
VTAYVDGASRGNPGPAGFGVYMTTDSGEIIEICGYLGTTTNNVAEYSGLIAGLQAAADLGAVGAVLWVLPFVLALVLALGANAPPGAVATFTILAAMGIWIAQGLVAGIPLDAVMWLGFGLAATAAAQRTSSASQGKWQP